MAHKTRRVSNRVLASAISLLFGTAAHGAFYPAHFDPAGTGTVPGFTGDAVFEIPDSCLADGWKPANVSGGCGPATLLSATVFLYSTSPGDPIIPGAHIDQFSIVGPFAVLGVTSLGGQPKEVDTDPEPPGGVPGESFYSDHVFWLQFVSGSCPTDICTPIPPGGDDFVLESTKVLGDPAFIFMDVIDLEHRSNPATVTFGPACPAPTDCVVVPVPEPGILGLILAALGAGWLTRRRKPLA